MLKTPLTVAWISDFPIEWLPDLPAALRALPRRHPATWAMVLLGEFAKNPALRVHVIVLREHIPHPLAFEQKGVTFHVLKASPKLRLATAFWVDTWLIRRLCRQLQPDLIHAWGSEKGAPLIAHRLPYPYLMTVQGLFAWYRRLIRLPAYFQLMELGERLSLRRAPVVTTESHFAVEFLKTHFPKPLVHQAEHAPNHAFHQVRRRPQTASLQFICVGGMSFRKGTDLLFAALDRLGTDLDFRLKIITNPDPQYLDSLRGKISARTWERTEFKYHLLPHEVAAELETPTISLLPTRADTSPNAVKEAVVAGLPVVAANVGGIPDYVEPGRNGLLFPPGDLEAFVAALRAACAHPLFRRGEVDAETLVRQRGYLSPELMAEKFLGAYESALRLGRKGKI